jgi:hypothetical protein
MDNPRNSAPCLRGNWIAKLVLVLGIVVLYRLLSQEIDNMRSSPRTSIMAAVAASFAQHVKAADASTVDLSWHAPNATAINNLTQVIGGSGIYGFIYNSSTITADEYGVYNWCNMPHVRATEYKTASSDYDLQYVEVVRFPKLTSLCSVANHNRFIAITNEPFTLRTLSLSNHTAGIVTMKNFSITDNRKLGRNRHTHIGRGIVRLRIHLFLLAFWEAANFPRSLLKGLMILGSMARIYMVYIMTCWGFFRITPTNKLRLGSHKMLLRAKSLEWC